MTSQVSWQRYGYMWYAFVMLKSYLRQRLEIDDFKEIRTSWSTFSPQQSIGSDNEFVHFKFIDLCEYSTWKLQTDFFENQCQLWSCLLSIQCFFLSVINKKDNYIGEIEKSNWLKRKHFFHSPLEKQNEEEMDILSGSTYLNYMYNNAVHHRPKKFLIVSPEKRSCGILWSYCSREKKIKLICFFNLFWPKLTKVNQLIHTCWP